MIPVIDTRNRINQITSKPDRRHDCKSKDLRPTEPADLACNATFDAGIFYACCVRRASQQLHQLHSLAQETTVMSDQHCSMLVHSNQPRHCVKHCSHCAAQLTVSLSCSSG